MGKYERDWAQQAEQDVAAGLNGTSRSSSIQMVVDAVRQHFGTSDFRSRWSGGDTYATPGDVELTFPSGDIRYLELKFSKKQGEGTAKNLSQACFKKVSESIKGYQAWDEDLGLLSQRYQLVEQRIGRPLANIEDYQTNLYRLRDAKDPIITKIKNITKPGQISYAEYAAQELNRHLPMVNQLTAEILGINDHSFILCVVKNFESANQTVSFPDIRQGNLQVTNVVASGKSIKFQNSQAQDVLRFSVTWKNICQGGKTPCFNVFRGKV